MATSATNITGVLIWFPTPDSAGPSSNDTSLLNKFASSVSLSAAMRRFPAGEELMQSPSNKKNLTFQVVSWFRCYEEKENKYWTCEV